MTRLAAVAAVAAAMALALVAGYFWGLNKGRIQGLCAAAGAAHYDMRKIPECAHVDRISLRPSSSSAGAAP